MGYKFIDGNINMFRTDKAVIPMSFNTDITDTVVYLSAKSELANTTFDLQVSQSVHTDPVNGITQITINSTDSDIEAGQYYMDIVISGSTLGRNTVFPAIENETAYLIILDHPKE